MRAAPSHFDDRRWGANIGCNLKIGGEEQPQNPPPAGRPRRWQRTSEAHGRSGGCNGEAVNRRSGGCKALRRWRYRRRSMRGSGVVAQSMRWGERHRRE